MKKNKKVISIVTAFVMLVVLFQALPTTTIEAKVKVLSGKKVTLEAGEFYSIVILQKGCTFKSSNKKVASVNRKGDIKAKKTGNCVITVKNGTSKAKVKVKVVPENVKIKDVQAVGSDSSLDPMRRASIQVTWKKAKGACGYFIYYSTKKKSGYKKVTVKGGKKQSAKVKGLTYGKTYYFKVKAYGSKKKLVSEEYSKVLSLKTWALDWSDEFNGTSLDKKNWEYNFVTGTNQEMETLTAGKNLKFQDGKLVIIPRMEVFKDSKKDTIYTSGKIDTKGKKEFTYGKMEIRAKATNGTGTWSAGWTLGLEGVQKGWPDTGEIDILESMKGSVPQTIHCRFFNNQKGSHGNKTFWTPLTQKQSAESYHTYTAVWTDTYIQFYCDGKKTGKYNSKIFTEKNFAAAWGDAFMHPHYFILNCAIGGNAAGNVTTEGWTKVSDTPEKTVYEDYYSIDYVRLYK